MITDNLTYVVIVVAIALTVTVIRMAKSKN